MGSAASQRSCHLGAALQTLGARARREGFYLDDEPGHTQARLDLQEKSVGAAERDEEKRSAWREGVKRLDAQRLVFVDECGTHIGLTPLRARAPKGERAFGRAPRNRGKNTTLIAALSSEGIRAPMSVEGATDSIAFEIYVEHFLCPALLPGQVIILDNLGAHKGGRVEELIKSRGCELLFLPSYSPDFSPIEEAFSKIKAIVRKAEARTREGLLEAIAQALEAVTRQDAKGWFAHCGYHLETQRS